MKSLESDLRKALDAKRGERAIHEFLKEKPILLESEFSGFGFCYACIPEFEFGAEFRADFLLLRPDSPGWRIKLIELKSPDARLYTKRWTPAKPLLAAMKQIQDWREWVRQNEPYLRQRLSKIIYAAPEKKKEEMRRHFKPSPCHEIGNMASTLFINYVILIGRSSHLSNEELRLRSMDLQHHELADIVTYDSLLRHAETLDMYSCNSL